MLEAVALGEKVSREKAMSANIEEVIQRQRKLHYADKTNEQLIMVALHRVLVVMGYNGRVLLDELDYRYRTDSDFKEQG